MVVLAFCMGRDLVAVLDSPIGQPLATVCISSIIPFANIRVILLASV